MKSVWSDETGRIINKVNKISFCVPLTSLYLKNKSKNLFKKKQITFLLWMHNIIDKYHCNSHKTSTTIIVILMLTVIITITTAINFNRYLLKRLNTIFEKLLVLRFTTYYNIRQSVVTIYDSSDYYIYDSMLLQFTTGMLLQFTTLVTIFHDRYYNSRHY